MKKQEVISQVQNSLGSLFTKDDVVNCLNMVVEEPKIEEEPKADFLNILNLVRNKVDRAIRDFNFDDSDNFEINNTEFSINYGNTIELDSFDVDARQQRQSLLELISEAFDELEEDHQTRLEIVAEHANED